MIDQHKQTHPLGYNLHVLTQHWKEGKEGFSEIFTPQLLQLLSELHLKFESRRQALLQERKLRTERYQQGELPQYLPQESPATQSSWQVAPIPTDLLCRRVEITGPVHSAKMVINMLNPNEKGVRADTAMLDFEDSMCPLWENVFSGIKNVIGAVEGTLHYLKRENNQTKTYQLHPDNMAGIMVRCRGLHMDEKTFQRNGQAFSAGLFDLAVCAFHTANLQLTKGRTPKFYIPKCEHFLEARWWNEVLQDIEDQLSLPHGTLKVTFLIETLPAAFQMEEILYELRERIVALNVGRWDKIFSDIKVLGLHQGKIMPDRQTITMQCPWMENYAKRLIKICHSRGALAIGGMSAFTPGKTPQIRQEQTQKVLADKKFENQLGHDGCWVSHPYFIPMALEAFPQINQLHRTLPEMNKYPDLLPPDHLRPQTLKGLRTNIRVGIFYMEGWLRGDGCIAVDGLMEDLATLEISRTQTWQWLHHQVQLQEGQTVTPSLIKRIFEEEGDKIIQELEAEIPHDTDLPPLKERFRLAQEKAQELYLRQDLLEFLTLGY